jgi:phosphotransferase system HPr (HPr) family protein
VPPSSEPERPETVVSLPAGVDLHARAGATLVRAALGFSSSIWLAAGDREVDAKSLLAVLALGARGATELRLRAEGPDAAAAVQTLAGLVPGLR